MYELSIPYRLVGPFGDVAVFNDPTDPAFAGWLSKITGLSSATVRSSVSDVPQGPGADVDPVLNGGRFVVLEGLVYPNLAPAARNAVEDRILAAADAQSADAVLRWENTGRGYETALWLREQAEPLVQGEQGPTKTFALYLVSGEPMILSWDLQEASDDAAPLDIPAASVVNLGRRPAWPVLKLHGAAGSGWTIKNETTGKLLKAKAGKGALAAGKTLTIDTDPRRRSAIDSDGNSRYGELDWTAILASGGWPSVAPGAGNRWTATAGTRLDLSWRHTSKS